MAAMAAIASGFDAMGSLVEGESGARAAEYNAGIAEQNANLAVQQAAVDEQRQRIMAKKGIGSMRAGYGASGVSIEGSAADVLEDSAANAELDSLLIRHGGQMRAKQFGAEAEMSKYKAYGSRLSGSFGAAKSLLGGAKGAAMSRSG